MTPESRERAAQLAALAALGGLSDAERAEFDAVLAEADPELRAECARAERVANELLLAITPTQPPATLWDRILKRVRRETSDKPAPASQPWKGWAASAGGLHTVRHDDRAWEPTSFAGIDVRRLHVDAVRREVTMLVRMAAGTAYPRHRHAGPEQCLVLAGELSVGDRLLQEGDYQFAAPESTHEIQSTRTGCTLLIVSGLEDELLAQ